MSDFYSTKSLTAAVTTVWLSACPDVTSLLRSFTGTGSERKRNGRSVGGTKTALRGGPNSHVKVSKASPPLPTCCTARGQRTCHWANGKGTTLEALLAVVTPGTSQQPLLFIDSLTNYVGRDRLLLFTEVD